MGQMEVFVERCGEAVPLKGELPMKVQDEEIETRDGYRFS